MPQPDASMAARGQNYPRALFLAGVLIVFAGAGLIAAELIGGSRQPTEAKRMVITVAAPGVIQARSITGETPTTGVAIGGYGCRHVASLGGVTVGSSCIPRPLSVAATE